MKKIALGAMVLMLCAAPAVAMEYNSGSILSPPLWVFGDLGMGILVYAI